MNSAKMTLPSMSSRSSVDRVPTRFSGGHGFDSCRGLRFFSLSHSRAMLINSSFTFYYRAQNSPSLFTYQVTTGCGFTSDWLRSVTFSANHTTCLCKARANANYI